MLSSLGPREGCKSSSSCCICWILWFVGVAFTGVVTRYAEMSRAFAVSSSVRNCSSRPSSSTNTIWGTPDAFVAFASVGPLAVVVPGAGFTELLTSHMASACPLLIINGSGWLLQNCVSVCCSHLWVLLVCLLNSAIFPRISANVQDVLQIRVVVLHTPLHRFLLHKTLPKEWTPNSNTNFCTTLFPFITTLVVSTTYVQTYPTCWVSFD